LNNYRFFQALIDFGMISTAYRDDDNSDPFILDAVDQSIPRGTEFDLVVIRHAAQSVGLHSGPLQPLG